MPFKSKKDKRRWEILYYKKRKKYISLRNKKYYKIVKVPNHKKEPWKNIFKGILQRCEHPKNKAYKYYGGRGIKCLITESEIKFLWFRDKAFTMKKPSIDRKENDGNYCIENCRFIEQGHNSAERNVRVLSKTVLQFDLKGNFIIEWKSTMDIVRKLGFVSSHISNCCTGKRNTSYGFIWKYKQ
jgi:hypothetical protein